MRKKSPSEQFLIKLRKYIKNYVRENYCPLNCILQRNYINIQHSLASSDDYFPSKPCILQKSYALAVDISSKPKYAYKTNFNR